MKTKNGSEKNLLVITDKYNLTLWKNEKCYIHIFFFLQRLLSSKQQQMQWHYTNSFKSHKHIAFIALRCNISKDMFHKKTKKSRLHDLQIVLCAQTLFLKEAMSYETKSH